MTLSISFIESIARKPNFEHGLPASDYDISSAERELGIRFSSEYIYYLKKYGYASYQGHILTGISPYRGNNVVSVTIEAKENNYLIDDCYVIEEAHIDGIIICQDYNGSVFLVVPGLLPQIIYNSLAEYIEL